MKPAPIPVPTETKMTCAWPRAAPNLTSAQALALPSLSTVTGRPSMPVSLARSGSPRQARFGANTTVPAASSTNPAAPTPTAATAQLGDHRGDRRGGPLRAGGRGGTPQFLDDAATLVDDPGSYLGASDINPDRQAHAGI